MRILGLALGILLAASMAAGCAADAPASRRAIGGTPSVAMQDARHAASGRVTGIADGDTLYVDIEGVSTRVRLAQIDAPEKGQAFGRRSEQSLRELVGKQTVTLRWSSADRYGRPLVQLVAGGVDVNAEQVRRGYAWVYRQYSDDAQLLQLEAAARQAGLGLWADPHPVAPWEWRRQRRAGETGGGD